MPRRLALPLPELLQVVEREVVAAQVEQVKDEVEQAGLGPEALEHVLERLKVRPAFGRKDDDLAVENGAFDLELERGFGDGLEASGPVVALLQRDRPIVIIAVALLALE